MYSGGSGLSIDIHFLDIELSYDVLSPLPIVLSKHFNHPHPRFQSDLLDRIAFEALPLVVCTKDSMYKKVVDTSLHPSTYFLGIADPTSTCCRPVLLAHAALL